MWQWIIAIVAVVLLIVFVFIPMFKNEEEVITGFVGAKLDIEPMAIGGKNQENEDKTTSGYQYFIEKYTGLDDAAKLGITSNNQYINIVLKFTPPPKFDKSEYFMIERTLPNNVNNSDDDTLKKVKITYQLLNDESFATVNERSPTNFMTIHAANTEPKDIIKTPTTGLISNNTDFFKDDPSDDPFIIVLWGEGCGSTAQSSGSDPITPNVLELFAKIDPKHYDALSETEKIPILNDKDIPIVANIQIPDGMYSRDFTKFEEVTVQYSFGASSLLDTEVLSSDILVSENPFYLGFKSKNQGALNFHRYLLTDGDNVTGTIKARSLFGNPDYEFPRGIMPYFEDDLGPKFVFDDVKRSERDQSRFIFRLKFTVGTSTRWITHSVANDQSTNYKKNTIEHLKYTNNEDDAKYFSLIQTPIDESTGEGSFKLVLDDYYNTRMDRWILRLRQNINLNDANAASNAIEIVHNLYDAGPRQFAVYCPIYKDLVGKTYNIYSLQSNPIQSEHMRILAFRNANDNVGGIFDRREDYITLPKNNKNAKQWVEDDQNISTNNNEKFIFETTDNGLTYRLKSANNKYMTGGTGYAKNRDGIYQDDSTETLDVNWSSSQSDIGKFSIVRVIGYPTTAALGLQLNTDTPLLHVMILYKRPGNNTYRPIYNPDDDETDRNNRGKGGEYVQILMRKVPE